jgi:hypothetical protein
MFGERVHHGGVGVGDQKHVRFVDRLKSPYAGAVKADPLFEQIRCELGCRYRKVLPQPRHIDKLEIHYLYFVLLH